MPLAVPIKIVFGILVTAAALTDWRWRRIPNWLVLPGLLAGFAVQVALQGPAGLLVAAKGMGLACAVYIPLWIVRGVGGGDVKLMAAVGSIIGFDAWLLLFVTTAVLGGICAVALSLAHGRLRETLGNVKHILFSLFHLRMPYEEREKVDVTNSAALRLPHGMVIAAAAWLWLVFG